MASEDDPLLEVAGLTKRFDAFCLDAMSFRLDAGYIMGFVGRNGAGKTTTLKCIMGVMRPDAGQVRVFGQDFRANELALKQQIGFALGEVPFYQQTKVARLAAVYRRFYERWDEASYQRYLRRFDIDDTKRIEQLSAGMKVKLSLAFALSHDARLFLLDEPTSGLDPVSRDDLLDLFRELIQDGRRSILFSTHITSDLSACADYITYIADGKVLASTDMDDFIASYRLVKGVKDQLTPAVEHLLVGHKSHDFGFTGLARTSDLPQLGGLEASPPTIDDIMVYHERDSFLARKEMAS